MSNYFYIIERCLDTNMYVGYVPNIRGAHSQSETIEGLHKNMKDIIKLVKNDKSLVEYNTEFISVEKVLV